MWFNLIAVEEGSTYAVFPHTLPMQEQRKLTALQGSLLHGQRVAETYKTLILARALLPGPSQRHYTCTTSSSYQMEAKVMTRSSIIFIS